MIFRINECPLSDVDMERTAHSHASMDNMIIDIFVVVTNPCRRRKSGVTGHILPLHALPAPRGLRGQKGLRTVRDCMCNILFFLS